MPKSEAIIAYLIDAEGQKIPLTEPETGLGRATDNQIVLNSSKTSRYHASIRRNEGQYYVRDLDSKNGTRLNGQPLQVERRLQQGDELGVGDINYVFEYVNPAEIETVSFYSSVKLPAQLEPSSLQLDLEAIQVRLDGQIVQPPLSLLEWKLLVVLYQHHDKVCSRDQIIESLYQNPAPDIYDTALETLVSRLRKRLNMHDPSQTPYIKAVRGLGYKLEL